MTNSIIYIIEQLKWNLLMLRGVYIGNDVENNDKQPKLGDHVTIWKYKNVF